MEYISAIKRAIPPCLILLSVSSLGEPTAGKQVHQAPTYGIASLLSFAPQDVIESIREGSQDPSKEIPESELRQTNANDTTTSVRPEPKAAKSADAIVEHTYLPRGWAEQALTLHSKSAERQRIQAPSTPNIEDSDASPASRLLASVGASAEPSVPDSTTTRLAGPDRTPTDGSVVAYHNAPPPSAASKRPAYTDGQYIEPGAQRQLLRALDAATVHRFQNRDNRLKFRQW